MDLGDLFNLTIVNRFNYASFHPFNEAKDPYQQHQAGLADSPNWDPLEARLSGQQGINVAGQCVIHENIFEPVPQYGPFPH